MMAYEQLLKKIPLPLPEEITKVVENSTEIINWICPSDISIIGSWTSKTEVDKVSCVDIALELPTVLNFCQTFLIDITDSMYLII